MKLSDGCTLRKHIDDLRPRTSQVRDDSDTEQEDTIPVLSDSPAPQSSYATQVGFVSHRLIMFKLKGRTVVYG